MLIYCDYSLLLFNVKWHATIYIVNISLCYLVLHFLSLQYTQTALHYASESGHYKVCQVLLQAGANVQAKDRVSTIIEILFTLITVQKVKKSYKLSRTTGLILGLFAKIWITTFPKEFFNEIWFKVGEHEQIYINVSEWRQKQFFWYLRNNANLC